MTFSCLFCKRSRTFVNVRLQTITITINLFCVRDRDHKTNMKMMQTEQLFGIIHFIRLKNEQLRTILWVGCFHIEKNHIDDPHRQWPKKFN